MTTGAVGKTLQKGQNKRDKQPRKDAKKLTKKAGKLAAAQGENAEIFARKELKIRKMPSTEQSKMLKKYKF